MFGREGSDLPVLEAGWKWSRAPPNWLRDDPTLELVLVGFAQRKLFLMAPLAAPGLGLGNTDTSRTEHAPWAKRSA